MELAAPTSLRPADAQSISTAVCRHCGDACDEPVVTDSGTFCCAGCASVYALLDAHALTGFYTCAPNGGVSLREADKRAPDRFAVLDDPATAAAFIESETGSVTHAVFHLPAMHCASCLWLLEQLWRFDEGVVWSEADLLRRTVRVSFRPADTSLRAIAERLASLGYEPVLDRDRATGETPRARRALYLKLGLAGFAFGNMMLFSVPRYANGAPLDGGFQHLFDLLNVLLALPVLTYSASDFFRSAWQAVRLRRITLDVPVALGLTVLFTRSLVDIATGRGPGYLDSFAGLVFFLLIGRLFQQLTFDRISFDRTVRSFLPLSVRVEDAGGLVTRPLEELCVGDVIFVRPGEVVPADATLLMLHGTIDYAFVTGESEPQDVATGDTIAAGGRVVGHGLRVKVLRPVAHSRLASLWSRTATDDTPPSLLTTVADRFGHWFTIFAVGLAVIGAIAWWPDAGMAAQVATAVLIIACPCAMTLAAPITLGTALTQLGLAGVYLRNGGVALELSRIDAIAFDKTGTLTAGRTLRVMRHALAEEDWARVRRLAAESTHPVSRALVGDDAVRGTVESVVHVSGGGIRGVVDGHVVAIGSAAFVAPDLEDVPAAEDARVFVRVDDRASGVTMTAPERPGMSDVTTSLSQDFDTWLMSGDVERDAPYWTRAFGDRMAFRLTPDGKRQAVEALQREGRHVLMVGDGLNDAAALATADVGMAVSDDSACLVPACDVVIHGSQLAQLPAILAYARRARTVIVTCFLVSVFYNVIGLSLALAGRLTPLATAILMPVSSLTIVGLSVGLMRMRAPRLPEAVAGGPR